MKGKSLVALAATTVMLGAAAEAQAAGYAGKVKGDSNSVVSFDVIKEDGKRKVAGVEYSGIDNVCENGDGSLTGAITKKGRVSNGDFDVRFEDATVKARFGGELKKSGKATGVLKVTVEFAPPFGTCKTGKVEWKAEKLA